MMVIANWSLIIKVRESTHMVSALKLTDHTTLSEAKHVPYIVKWVLHSCGLSLSVE